MKDTLKAQTRSTPLVQGGARIRALLTLLDVGVLAIVTAAFWGWILIAALPEDERSVLLKLWLLISILSSLLSRLSLERTIIRGSDSTFYAPAWSLLISLLVMIILNLSSWLPVILIVHAAWFLCIIGLTWYIERFSPPLRLGIFLNSIPAAKDHIQSPASHTGISLIPISTPHMDAFVDIDGLLIGSAKDLSSEQQRFVEHAQVTKVPVWSWAQFEEEVSGRVSLDLIQSNWLNQSNFYSRYSTVKRFFDIFVTVFFIPLLLPLMLVVALIVYFNSGSPILFWQERVGRNNETFKIVKFRTMTRDSEHSGPAFAQHGDLRVTPVGALLRKFRLDELPQFWNVLLGQMSVIGPRPEQQAFAVDFEESIPLYATRHWVRPGITGWAQVNQGYAANVGQTMEKLRYDFYYVKHFSVQLDILIVFKTLWTILTGFGAR